jgi:hypothetical protein
MNYNKTLLGVTISLVLTGCLIGDPGDQLGDLAILSFCATSRVQFETPTACRIYYRANAPALVESNVEYSILLPDDISMASFFSKNNVTEAQFAAGPALVPFLRRHILRGVIVSGSNFVGLDGTSRTVTGASSDLQIDGKQSRVLDRIGKTTFVRLVGTL